MKHASYAELQVQSGGYDCDDFAHDVANAVWNVTRVDRWWTPVHDATLAACNALAQ